MTPRLFYAILQMVSILVCVIEIFYVSFQKPSNIQKHLSFILMTIFISNIGYLIELLSHEVKLCYVGIMLGYVGKPFALLGSALLLAEYSGIKIKKSISIPVFCFFAFLTMMVITNKGAFDWGHHLYYKDFVFDDSYTLGSPFKLELKDRGPFWWVYMVGAFSIFGAFTGFSIYEFKNCKTKQAKQMSVLLFFVVFSAFIGLILYVAGLTYHYDTTLLGILIGTIIMIVLLTKYRMFDSLTLAQAKALDDSINGVVVADARNLITYFNTEALKIVPELSTTSRKKESEALAIIESYKPGQPIFHKDKIYEMSVEEVYSGRKRKVLVGKTYRFVNITDHHKYQERLHDDINAATGKIKSIQRRALISFADIVEARDGNTGAHIKNIAFVSRKIAEALMMNSKYKKELTLDKINIIAECAPLHDVGKIYIPDAILTKPGKLTPEEFEIMKTHAAKGGDIIRVSIDGIEEEEYVQTAKEIAVAHHERWDGTGYPNKLKGKDIPLSGRIVAVADVYDALRMKRPYKDAFPKDVAINIIKEESGTHFDPEIVKAFLTVVDQLN